MSSQLSSVPVGQRRHAATLLGVLAVLLLAIGILPWTRPTDVTVRVLAVVALVAALLVAALAWGLWHSTILDARRAAEAELDATLIAAAAGVACSCGHDHDPDEMHVSDARACGASEGDCTHTCETCVLATLRD